jgi:hypothetical protein
LLREPSASPGQINRYVQLGVAVTKAPLGPLRRRTSLRQAYIGLALLIMSLLSPACAQTKHQVARQETTVRVPFVGCPSDGQVSPEPAPKGNAKLLHMDGNVAQVVAFYKGNDTSRVIAPRGWHCFETSGSNGSNLYVTPQPINSGDLFSSTWKGFTGPAIQVSESLGGTSGRFEVARVVARAFPTQRAFVDQVIKEGQRPASDFPFGLYPTDKVIFQSNRVVEYQTPRNSDGLGTMSMLKANDLPINGVVILRGEDPDALQISVRLPPTMNDLASQIIKQIERDNSPTMH